MFNYAWDLQSVWCKLTQIDHEMSEEFFCIYQKLFIDFGRIDMYKLMFLVFFGNYYGLIHSFLRDRDQKDVFNGQS